MTVVARELPLPEAIRPELFHGVPVLNLHAEDPIPSPRAPVRYAVRVHPDLARYLLTKNHPQNRPRKLSAIAKYVRDMTEGFWEFTPESLIFSASGVLQNGQNRLLAVAQSGQTVWLMVDFGWPEDLIERIDRGSARLNSDGLKVLGVFNQSVVAATIAIVASYDATVRSDRRWLKSSLTSSETIERYNSDPEGWAVAALYGRRAYDSTSGLGPTTWAAAYYLIGRSKGVDVASSFFEEVMAETGQPGSPSRRLKSHYLRRRVSDTASGDNREPLENILRAFNAWKSGKAVGFVRVAGPFHLSTIR